MFLELLSSQVTLPVLLAILVIVITIPRLNRLDPREPPVPKPLNPVFGHMAGLIWYSTAYFQKLCDENPSAAAFTIPIPKAKTYVITTPSLLQAIQRNSRLISFSPLLGIAAERMAGASKQALSILRDKHLGGQGGSMKTLTAMHPALSGDGLDEMNEKMIKNLKVWNDALAARAPLKIDLFEWCKEVMTVAASQSTWGDLNPFQSKEVRDAFWDFEGGINNLLLNFLPQITARRGWTAREKLIDAFVEYYKADGTKTGSRLAQARWNSFQDLGLSLRDRARLETSMAIGLLANTIPSSFWFLFDVCSRPELLDKIRNELLEGALHVNSETKSAIVDLADIREKCPLTVAAFQESLRMRMLGRATRFVNEDVVIDNKYLLKKGAVVQIPYQAVHKQSNVWGPGSKDFDPTRFIKPTPRRVGGFLEFGISPSTCPGRHFATGEIVGFVAALILRFDLTHDSALPGSPWAEPEVRPSTVITSHCSLKEPFFVTATPRELYRDYDWDFQVTRGKGHFDLVMG